MSRSVTRMSIDDALHFTPEKRAQIIESYPPHEREARIKGIPAMGSGRVFPITEESITCQAFEPPRHWAQIAGLDFGWDHPTAAVRMAWDRDADVIYVMDCYRRKEATPVEHYTTLRSWGDLPWSWPQDAYQRDKRSGGSLRQDYLDLGLRMAAKHATFPDGGNGVEAGIMQMLQRMQGKRFKVFAHLEEWFAEFRMYHRKDGLIVKERDDLMDATRYGVMMLRIAEPPDVYEDDWAEERMDHSRNEATGY